MNRTRRTFAVVVALVIWYSITNRVIAQEQKPPADAPVADTAKPPKATSTPTDPARRELVFKEDMGSAPEMIYQSGEALPRQRFVAVFQVKWKARANTFVSSIINPDPEASPSRVPIEFQPIIDMMGAQGDVWIGQGAGGSFEFHVPRLRNSAFCKLVDNVPERLKPTDAILMELLAGSIPTSKTIDGKTSPQDKSYLKISPTVKVTFPYSFPSHYGSDIQNPVSTERQKSPNEIIFQHQVIAEEREHLKELVRPLISIYDHSFPPKYHEALIVGEKSLREKIEGYRKDVQNSEKELASDKKQFEELKSFEDLTAETLANLSAQKRLIKINLAGIQARIDACDKILATRKELSTSRIDQVETVKITAEIESIGLAAEEKAISDIIAAGQRRRKLQSQINNTTEDLSKKKRYLKAYGMALVEYQKAIADRWSHATVSEITILPIRWTPWDEAMRRLKPGRSLFAEEAKEAK